MPVRCSMDKNRLALTLNNIKLYHYQCNSSLCKSILNKLSTYSAKIDEIHPFMMCSSGEFTRCRETVCIKGVHVNNLCH